MSARAAADHPGAGRLLAGIRSSRPTPLAEHVARLGPLPLDAGLIEEVAAAGLSGRGGAAFDTATKLRAVAGARQPLLVANGAEGEPASNKDKTLLRSAPHLVLDGVIATAHAIGAREAVVAIAAAAHKEHAVLAKALSERRSDPLRVRVAVVPDGFVTGEETALLGALQGRSPKPTLKPPYPFERGPNGVPTLVQNVETLAHVALITRFGADWFRSAGAADAAGSALVTLGGAIKRPGVHEIELGSTLGELLKRGGGAREPLTAILVGGYFGRWVSHDDATTLRLLPEILGAGAILALPASTCGIAEAARVTQYLADESAGQCGPCVHGLQALAGAFRQLAGDPAAGTSQLERWIPQVRGRGACRHPDGVATFVESFLRVFETELRVHARSGRCRAPGARGWLPLPAASS